MQSSKYENLMKAVSNAVKVSSDMDRLVEVMKNTQGKKLTFKEVGVALYGEDYLPKPEDYVHEIRRVSLMRHLAAIMASLVDHCYVKKTVEVTDIPVVDKKGNPITTETWEKIKPKEQIEDMWVWVTDAKGREFQVQNPYYEYHPTEYKKVTKTVYQKITYYEWR